MSLHSHFQESIGHHHSAISALLPNNASWSHHSWYFGYWCSFSHQDDTCKPPAMPPGSVPQSLVLASESGFVPMPRPFTPVLFLSMLPSPSLSPIPPVYCSGKLASPSPPPIPQVSSFANEASTVQSLLALTPDCWILHCRHPQQTPTSQAHQVYNGLGQLMRHLMSVICTTSFLKADLSIVVNVIAYDAPVTAGGPLSYGPLLPISLCWTSAYGTSPHDTFSWTGTHRRTHPYRTCRRTSPYGTCYWTITYGTHRRTHLFGTCRRISTYRTICRIWSRRKHTWLGNSCSAHWDEWCRTLSSLWWSHFTGTPY